MSIRTIALPMVLAATSQFVVVANDDTNHLGDKLSLPVRTIGKLDNGHSNSAVCIPVESTRSVYGYY